VTDDKWRMVDCIPVRRNVGTTWTARTGAEKQTIWFVPELFGTDLTDPNNVLFGDWIVCQNDFQTKRWVVSQGAGDSSIVFCIPTVDALVDASTACKIWRGDPLSETSEVIDVWLDWATGNEPISAGTQCTAKNEAGRWHFLTADCEGEGSEAAVKVGKDSGSTLPDPATTSYGVFINADGVFILDSATWVSVSTSGPA
jgi:hypothetical protein